MNNSSGTGAVQIDVSDVLERLGQNQNLFCRLLGSFKEKLAQAEERLNDERNTLVDADLQSWLHQLKGNAGNMGAQALWQCAGQLEGQMKQGQAISAEELSRLAELISLTRVAVASELDGHSAGATKSEVKAPTDLAALLTELTDILALLDSDYGRALRQLEDLEEDLKAAGFAAQTADVLEVLYEFDTDEGTRVLERLMRQMREAQ